MPFSLSPIRVNRLVLNLRKAGNQNDGDISTISQPRFATNGFLDNIGASLRGDPEDVDVGDGSEEYELEKYVLSLIVISQPVLNLECSRISPVKALHEVTRMLPHER